MSRAPNGEDGLSPPPRTIYDIFGEDEEDDDIYEPAAEESTDADGVDDEDDDQFLGESTMSITL